VTLQTIALDRFPVGEEKFNKVVAINVNVFWQQPASELSIIRRRLYLFYQSPTANGAQDIRQRLTSILQKHEFSVMAAVSEDLKTGTAIGVTAAVA
jgi:hypothetical protein